MDNQRTEALIRAYEIKIAELNKLVEDMRAGMERILAKLEGRI